MAETHPLEKLLRNIGFDVADALKALRLLVELGRGQGVKVDSRYLGANNSGTGPTVMLDKGDYWAVAHGNTAGPTVYPDGDANRAIMVRTGAPPIPFRTDGRGVQLVSDGLGVVHWLTVYTRRGGAN